MTPRWISYAADTLRAAILESNHDAPSPIIEGIIIVYLVGVNGRIPRGDLAYEMTRRLGAQGCAVKSLDANTLQVSVVFPAQPL